MSYKFRLQKLLDIRLSLEEESKRLFKTAQLEKEKAQHRLNNLKENYNKYRETQPGESLVEQKLKHIYLNALNISIMEAYKNLEEKNNNLECCRNELKQRQIERKTVEILKEKQLEAYNKEQNFIEQKTNDEFGLYGFLRVQEGR